MVFFLVHARRVELTVKQHGASQRVGCVEIFHACHATSSSAVCNVCKVNVSRGGGSTEKYNTTNLNQGHTKAPC